MTAPKMITILDTTSGDLRDLPATTPVYPMPSNHEITGGYWNGASNIEPTHLESAACGTLGGTTLGSYVLIADEGQTCYLEPSQDVWLTDDDGTNRYDLAEPRQGIALWESRVVSVTGQPRSIGLGKEALEAAKRGETFEVVRCPYYRNPSGEWVETLIIHAPGGASGDIGRAGQSCGADPDWGDWDPETETITLDTIDDEGRAIVVRLDGRQVVSD